MRAKLIYSDLLYTSSLYVLKEVKENLGKYKKHIIIVPDKYTLICENLLLDALGVDCSFDAEVMSLNRLCKKVVKIDEVVNKQGGVILVQKILYENNDKLKVFKNMYKKIGFAEKLYSSIIQIKASGIKPEILTENDSDEVLLQSKIDDIKLVYLAYEDAINGGLSDGLYKLEKLNEAIQCGDLFENVAFYFAFFDFFTMQEYKILESLIVSNNYVVVGASFALGKLNEHIYTNEVFENIRSIFFKYNLKDIVEVNEVLPSYFEKLKNELFAFSPRLEQIKSNAISMYSASGEDCEIENIARIIKSYIVAGKKYNQMAVAISSIEKYEKAVEDIFLSYDIPYFIDKSIELKNTELGRFISAILKGLVYGFMEEDLNSIIFNYYFGINDDSEKQAVYKFVSRLRPSGVKWLDKTYDFASEVVLNAIKKIKEKFDFIISTFKACKTGKDFVSATNCILSYFNVEQMTDELASVMKEDLRANKILGQVYGKTVELLEQILKLSPNTEYDELSFSKLLQNGLDACKINLVPQSVDCVFIGDINNSSFERKDIMFIAGLNMGVAPLVSYDLGIVTDKDIDNLSSKYLIEPKISQINMRARQKLFEICLLAKKNLILSYLVVDNAGNELKPSNVITSISKMFYFENGKQFVPFMIENDLHLQNELYHFIEGKGEKGGGKSYTSSNDTQVIVANKNDDLNKKASFKHFVTFIANKKNVYKYMLEEKSNEKILYNILQLNGEGEYAKYLLEMPKIIKEKAKNSYAKDLFFENGKTSATEITEFYACPYKHFVNKGLKLIEDLPFSLNKMDIGKILHRVCELFAKSIMHKKVLTNDEFDTISKHIINQIKQEYKNIFEDESNRFIIASLLKEAEKLMQKLNYFAKNSSFDIAKTEYRFTPFEIKNDIKSVKLSGQIDRLDCYDNKCIVIDYKTGNSDLKIKDIYYGIKIQLLLYALAITKESNLQVAGFGYYPIKDKYVKNNQGVIEDYKVNGYYLNEYDVLKAMDNTLIDNENCNSQLYNFKITYKKAGISFSNNLIEREKVAKLINYVNTLLESAVCNILNGEISVSPFVDGNQSPCGFCSYKGICKKDLFVKERNISNKKLEDII